MHKSEPGSRSAASVLACERLPFFDLAGSPIQRERGTFLRLATAACIDGGLVNPVPVSLARALGADIVIAVDLNSELVGRRFSGSDIDLTASTTAPAVSAQVPRWLMDAVGPILQRVLQAGLDYPSYFEVLANSLNIMQDRITRMRLAGDPPDVLLCPRLGEFSWLDFHRANEAIAEGLACVQAAEPMIRRACRDAVKTSGG